MTFLNQFHKEAMERTMRKIEESEKSPMNSKDFADYMRRNLEQAKKIEAGTDTIDMFSAQLERQMNIFLPIYLEIWKKYITFAA